MAMPSHATNPTYPMSRKSFRTQLCLQIELAVIAVVVVVSQIPSKVIQRSPTSANAIIQTPYDSALSDAHFQQEQLVVVEVIVG